MDMTPFEVSRCLESLTILVDTREHDTDRAKERLASFPCPWRRQALAYGDYSYSYIRPDGMETFPFTEKAIPTECMIERKSGLDEMAMNFGIHRERFKREFERAAAHGAKKFLIVEGATIEKLLGGRYRSKLNPNAYLASLVAWSIRYEIGVWFCRPETCARMIYEICKRDLKERLEGGG